MPTFFYGVTPKELADEGIRLESYPIALRQDNTKHAARIARYWAEKASGPRQPPMDPEEKRRNLEEALASWRNSPDI